MIKVFALTLDVPRRLQYSQNMFLNIEYGIHRLSITPFFCNCIRGSDFRHILVIISNRSSILLQTFDGEKIQHLFTSERALKLMEINQNSLTIIESVVWHETGCTYRVCMQMIDGSVVGELFASPFHDTTSIRVSSNWQRRKVGTYLMTKYVDFVKLCTDLNTIRFVCLKTNIGAKEMYKKLGFQITHNDEMYDLCSLDISRPS